MITDLDKKDINELIRKALCCATTGGGGTLQTVTDAGNTTTNDIILNIVPNVTYGKLYDDGGSPAITLQSATNVGMNLSSGSIQFYTALGIGVTIYPTSLTAARDIIIPDLSGTIALMGANNVGNFTLDGALYLKPGTTDRYKISYDSANAALRFDGNYTIFSNENGFASFFFRDAVNGIFMTMAGGAVGIGNFATNGYKFEVTGSTKISGRFQTSISLVSTTSSDLTLGTDGNVFQIANGGVTTINAITKANWSAGSEVTFIFLGSFTMKHNTAGGAGTGVMRLAGAADFAATTSDILKLVFNGVDWYEVSRSVN